MTAPAAAAAAAAAAERVKHDVEVAVSRHDQRLVPVSPSSTLTSPPRRAAVDTAVFTTTHLPPPPPCDRRTRRSPPPPARPGIQTPTTRPASHTAPPRPLAARADPVPVVPATHGDVESLPVGFEMTSACPICQTAIPFDASTSDAFSRHVDECISRVTCDQPPPRDSSSRASTSRASPPASPDRDRTCPVCNDVYPASAFSQADFERHVNDHFTDDDPASLQFVPLL